jgi:putative nucleotidyltransferase with HDIG domain
MAIHIVADRPDKILDLQSLLEPRRTTASLLGDDGAGPVLDDVVIVHVDLAVVDNIVALKRVIPKTKNAERRIFILDRKHRILAVQATALTATHVLESPVSARVLLDALGEAAAPAIESRQSTQDAAREGAESFASMFSAAQFGMSVDVADVRRAAGRIADDVIANGLSNWLETVRRHHEGTYQHCLLVTGIAVAFALKLGLSKSDLERLSLAAMYHDIGKAKIPPAVLDKPGRLDDAERTLIERHPVFGYDVLKETAGISPEILDAVRHHHEYLDGSGYPDGLKQAEISDVVRMLTISDIFAALIEERPYKASMPRQQAYNIISGMHDKLEMPLVAAFEEVALIF